MFTNLISSHFNKKVHNLKNVRQINVFINFRNSSQISKKFTISKSVCDFIHHFFMAVPGGPCYLPNALMSDGTLLLRLQQLMAAASRPAAALTTSPAPPCSSPKKDPYRPGCWAKACELYRPNNCRML